MKDIIVQKLKDRIAAQMNTDADAFIDAQLNPPLEVVQALDAPIIDAPSDASKLEDLLSGVLEGSIETP